MAFSLIKFLKGIVITEEGTLTPREVEILPGGAANTKTTIQASQTANQTITLPDATDTLVGKATTDTLTSKSIDATTNTLTNISNSSVAAAAAIDATKLGNGDVDNTELSYVSGVTSSIQTQLTTNSTSISNHTSATSAHGTAGTVVGTTDAQTLTNKTIDASNNTLTNIDVAASTNLATVTTLDEATTNTASTINIGTGTGANVVNIGGANSTVNITGNVNNNNVTNLNVTDKLITINDGGGAGSGGNSGFEIEEAGSPTGYFHTSTDRNSFEFKAPNTAGVVALTPGAIADNVVLASAQQMLLNKDIDGATASNVHRITVPKETLSNLQALTRKEATVVYGTDTQKMYVDNGTNLVAVGTGGVFNYFPTGDAESGLTISSYADGGTSPTDGQGGSPSLSVALTSSSPLANTKSFYIGTGNTGDGFSILSDTINPKDYGKVFALTIDMQYVVSAGTPAASDFGVFVLDVNDSNRQLTVQPNYVVDQMQTTPSRMVVYVQIPMNATQLRFCFHQRQTISTTYYFKAEFSMTEQVTSGYAPIQTDWESVTPVFSQFGTVTALSIYKKQDGSDLLLRGNFTTGTIGSGSPYIEMPNGLRIDDSKFPSGVVSILGRVPRGVGAAAGGTYSVNLVYNGSDNTKLYFSTGNNGDAPTAVVSNASLQFNSSEIQMIAEARIPILGWSSATQVVSSYDGRVVAARRYLSTNLSTTADAVIDFQNNDFDSNSMWNSTTKQFDIKVAGKYHIAFTAYVGSGSGGYVRITRPAGNTEIYLTTFQTSGIDSGSTIQDLNVGDKVDFRWDSNGITLSATAGGRQATYCDISLLSGAQQILSGIGTNPAIISSVYTSGTNGGAISNAAYQAAPVNTIVSDTSNLIQNSASFTGTGGTNTDFQLAAGTYHIRATCPVYTANSYAKIRLYNSTDSSVVTIGQSKYDNNGTCTVVVSTVVTITSTKTFQVQARTNNSASFGEPASLGDAETYTIIEIKKM